MSKRFLAGFGVALAVAAAADPASAIVFRQFGGTSVGVTDGTQISQYVSLANTQTFTNAAQSASSVNQAGCGFNQNGPTTVGSGAGGGNYFVARDTVTATRLNPGTNSTNCFATVNRTTANGSFLFEVPLQTVYFGFYWGSPDVYNYFRVLDGLGNPISFTTFGGTSLGNEITGDEIQQLTGISAPNSVYVHFTLSGAEVSNATYFEFGSTNYAFEFDNFVVDQVLPTFTGGGSTIVASTFSANGIAAPAPAALGLFGLGLGVLAVARRRSVFGL